MQAFDYSFQHSEADAHLQLQAEQICCVVELSQVEKILLLPGLTAVPEAPDYLAGILNYHGNNVPVIDLAIRLGQEVDTPYTADTPVVLVKCPKSTVPVALIVTGIGQVQDIPRSDFQLVEQFSDKALPFTALVNLENEFFWVLNTDTLLNTSLSSLNAATPEELNKLVQALMNQHSNHSQ